MLGVTIPSSGALLPGPQESCLSNLSCVQTPETYTSMCVFWNLSLTLIKEVFLAVLIQETWPA